MKETSYLIKNTGLLALGQFGTKFLSFFLVPLYTHVLSSTEYGTYDFYNTTVSLLIPLLTLNICDSALRFSLDKDCDKTLVFSISIKYFLYGLIIGILLVLINYIFSIIEIVNKFPILFVLMFAVTSLNGILSFFARGIEAVKQVAISGVICTVVMIILNILFLIPLKMGLLGFFLASIIGSLFQCIYLIVSLKIWKYFSLSIDRLLQKQMIGFCTPLILNNVSWWVNSVANRYVIIIFCGLSANGIFAVSYKIPSILVIFQTVFSQAWTISAVKDFDKDDKSGFFSRIYSSYNICMIIVCSILIIFSKDIAYVLYQKEFFDAWLYVPFLLIASLFGAMSGYIGAIFSAVKDSKIYAKSSVIGAGVNIVLTIFLVYNIQLMGAAIATTVSYFVIWLIRLFHVKRYIKLRINYRRDFLMYLILIIQSLLLLTMNFGMYYYLVQMLLLLMILYSCRGLLQFIIEGSKSKLFGTN